MENIDQLAADAAMGEEARKFIESELGRCVLGLAQQETEAAREALETVNPGDTQKIMELQQQARFGRTFGQWLRELVDEGEHAIQIFQQQKREA